MSTKKIFRMGFLSMIAAIGVFAASTGLAAAAQRVDVIDHLPKEGVQWDSMKRTSGQSMRVDVIDSIGSHGAVYPSTSGAMRVDVIGNIRV